MKWVVVAFKHPEQKRSVLYRQNIPDISLIDVVHEAKSRGANLMSIRGFPEEGDS